MAALNIDVLAQEAAEGTPQTECMYDCLSGGDRREPVRVSFIWPECLFVLMVCCYVQ